MTFFFFQVSLHEFDKMGFELHSVRGQSVFLNLALTEENMQIKFDLKLSVYSLGLDI